MTLLENSSWFSHIHMPEKLDYGLTNSQLPHQAWPRSGAPRSSCPTSSGMAGGGCYGLGCCEWKQGVQLWQRAVLWQLNLLLRSGYRLTPRQTVETRAQLASPLRALLVCWLGVPHSFVSALPWKWQWMGESCRQAHRQWGRCMKEKHTADRKPKRTWQGIIFHLCSSGPARAV